MREAGVEPSGNNILIFLLFCQVFCFIKGQNTGFNVFLSLVIPNDVTLEREKIMENFYKKSKELTPFSMK